MGTIHSGNRCACRPSMAPAHLVRRGGDSNPRYPLEVQRLSRAPDSATLAPLPFEDPPAWLRRAGRPPCRGTLAEQQRRGAPRSPALYECDRGEGEKRAEREGFEPPEPQRGSTVFKTASFDHSDTSPQHEPVHQPDNRHVRHLHENHAPPAGSTILIDPGFVNEWTSAGCPDGGAALT